MFPEFHPRFRASRSLFGLRTVTAFLILGTIFARSLEAGAGEAAAPGRTPSFHGGFLHPAGVDVLGYTVEHRWREGVYPYYTFGLPSFAAAGLAFYAEHDRPGPVVTVGVGLGSIAYASVAYQWRLRERLFLKVGGGYTTGIAYSGLFPVASVEKRY